MTTVVRLRVEGMDCGACALKIENALIRVPGASDISVSYQKETLSLSLDETQTLLPAVEDKIRALGFLTSPIVDTTIALPAVANAKPWWQSAKARLVLATGGLIALAYGLAQIFHVHAFWIFAAVAAVTVMPILQRALAAARSGSPFTIETLMSVAAIGAILIGEAQEATIVILLFAIGELLEAVAAGRARAGIEALINLIPRSARRERGGVIEEIPAEALEVGDVVVVRPGDRVPSDGIVIEGVSELDESPVTGESIPVKKHPDSQVYAGSINAHAALRVRITHKAADNTIARIVHLVEEAQESKAPMARFIDRFSRWYTPAAMVVAFLVMVVPPVLFDENWQTWVYRGLATLLIACPCALVISTPAAIASGLAAGARQGLLIKGGAVLETLGKVRSVAFDKTGTLTRGRPQVTDVVCFDGEEDEMLGRAAAVEAQASHPLGQAIVRAADARGIARPITFGGSQVIAGKGVTARLKSGFVTVGSPTYADQKAGLAPQAMARIEALEQGGKTVVVVFAGKIIEGLIAIRDEPREDAAAALTWLRVQGIRAVMLTGDNPRTASAIAQGLGIEVEAGLLPEAKLDRIRSLGENAPVAMVGDGINDAPALAAAAVGIAMGGGTDVALETADAALLKDRVTGVADLVSLSQATIGNIWQNIALALGLKAIFLVTTLTGTTTLWMAILADTGATVLVTANALRLLAFKGRPT
ncbi:MULTISPECIES: heavy metal translocating P-type ATPase [Asticcacaulis]|uniref:heavy metal translocating P-type ATPase n=1 Tax=Asticcacaulis TaxID=76890 RepID=UPI001FD9AF64|nr:MULTISPECIES: heavy metal translocating P-type ATPase [Asticcacaulis]MBP2160477.1 Cd2+/Zn2+-exporting ATPase [Asticcacaulis solisilvae]MDR6801522.1 Cd2+/Zn2+-exporting ATPase [Asticcacaulis sp. BE141]